MKTENTIQQLTEAKNKTQDPNLKKELDFKINALKQNKTVNK